MLFIIRKLHDLKPVICNLSTHSDQSHCTLEPNQLLRRRTLNSFLSFNDTIYLTQAPCAHKLPAKGNKVTLTLTEL